MSENQIIRLNKAIKRREKGEPMAYILGYKDFYGMRFKVNKDVLIPRPETEELINIVIASLSVRQTGASDLSSKALATEEAISKNKGLPRSDAFARNDIKILDVGTGSGCIAIALAKILPTIAHDFKFKIYASDISTKALTIGKQNAKKHNVKIKFIHSDILQNVRMTFDVLVANLPYVPKKIYDLRFKDLRFEPKGALVDPKKDFDLYQRLFKQIASLPSLPKAVFLEIDPKQKTLLPKIIKKYLPQADIKFHKDFNNLWRFAEIASAPKSPELLLGDEGASRQAFGAGFMSPYCIRRSSTLPWL